MALLGNRTAFTYKELFSILTNHARRLQLQFRPAKITSDFEAALVKAVSNEVCRLLFSQINSYSNL
jgi:hypothetical protein